MSDPKQGKNFCFTLNNPTAPPEFPPGTKYVYQLECGEQGTPHYQGYCIFSSNKTFAALKKLLPTAHWENRHGTHEQAYDYCTKEDTRLEAPVIAMERTLNPGKRTDIDGARDKILGKRLFADVVNDPDPELVRAIKMYPRWVNALLNCRPPKPMEDVVLRPWQKELVDELMGPPHPREIIWCYDEIGNQGKSFLATYLGKNLNALRLASGKTSDIAHVYNGQSIVVWDLARSQQETINYGVMEEIKNGVIFSPKYDSCVKYFDIPHVVVFANFRCPDGKFSNDRLRTTDLSPTPWVNAVSTSYAPIASSYVPGFKPLTVTPAEEIAEYVRRQYKKI